MAELYIFFWFSADFKNRYPDGIVLRDREYLSTTVTGQKALDIVLRRLRTDFRNIYEQRKNKELVRQGAKPRPNDLRMGGARKPDAIGLAIDHKRRAIVCELVEVSTLGQASSTMREDIQDKLDILRGPVKARIDADLRLMNERASLIATEFVAFGSAYIPGPAARQVPLLSPAPQSASSAISFEWICYWPTCERRLCMSGPLNYLAEPETAPTRGLILYEIHTTPNPAVVKAMEALWKRFERWYRERTGSLAPSLDLIPSMARRYWNDQPDELEIVLGYVALGLGALLVIAAAIYLAPAVLGAGALLVGETELAIGTSAAAAGRLLPVAYSAVSTAFAVKGVQGTGIFAFAP